MTAPTPCTSCQGRTTIVDPVGQEEEPYTCPDCGGSGKARDQIETAPTPGTPATTWPTPEVVEHAAEWLYVMTHRMGVTMDGPDWSLLTEPQRDTFRRQARTVLSAATREVAARVEAARGEGRAEAQTEMDTAVHALLGQRDAEESAAMQLRAERAELLTELGQATAQIARLRAEVERLRRQEMWDREPGGTAPWGVQD